MLNNKISLPNVVCLSCIGFGYIEYELTNHAYVHLALHPLLNKRLSDGGIQHARAKDKTEGFTTVFSQTVDPSQFPPESCTAREAGHEPCLIHSML